MHVLGPWQVRSLAKSRSRLLVSLAAAALVGCGGGGDEACIATAGIYPLAYEPGISNGGYSRLFYRAGSDQEWKLVFRGTSEACSRGLQASAVFKLPEGYSIDPSTGV